MSKKPLEIYVVLGEPPASVLAAKVWLESKGDLYVTNHAHLLAGKYSYHATGVTHSYMEAFQRRMGTGAPPFEKLRGMKGFQEALGLMCPTPLAPTGYSPRIDTKHRRTLIAPTPQWGWFVTVWAIQVGRRELAAKIAQTDPWPEVPVRASLLADWTDPWLLVTVSEWKNNRPYQVIHYEPAIPGRVPMEVIPRSFDGTWLEAPGPKWKPGEPFPEEWFRERKGLRSGRRDVQFPSAQSE